MMKPLIVKGLDHKSCLFKMLELLWGLDLSNLSPWNVGFGYDYPSDEFRCEDIDELL